MTIFPTQPRDTTRPDRDVLWPCAIALGTLAVGISLAIAFDKTIITVLAMITAGAGAAIAWGTPYLRVRWATVELHHDVSAASCHDRFLQLGLLVCASPRRAQRHWAVLENVASHRKHPNTATFAAMNATIAGGITSEALERTRTLLLHIISAKRQVRDAAAQRVRDYLQSVLHEHATLVLYGFSTTACTALRDLEPVPNCTIVIVQDQQYGSASQREHEHALRHLKGVIPTPYVIDFQHAADLFAANRDATIPTLEGPSFSVPARRHIIVLLGCETYSTAGTILVPARTNDPNNDTATFLDAVHEARRKAPRFVQLAIASESYKLCHELTVGDTLVTAPLIYSIKNAGRILRFLLTGEPHLLDTHRVELVSLKSTLLSTIIDDNGEYTPPQLDGLPASLAAWTGKVRAASAPPDPGFAATCDVYIFDMNGVLVDDEHDHQVAFADLVRRQRKTLSLVEYVRHCQGKSDVEGIEALKKAKKLVGSTAHLIRQKQQLYARNTRGTKLYPKAIELVRHLDGLGKRLYLVTAASAAETQRFLDDAQLHGVFAKTYAAITTNKHYATYKRVLHHSRVDPHAIVVIDDSPVNIGAAQRLQLRTIGVQTTRRDAVRADQLVDDAEHLLAILTARPKSSEARENPHRAGASS